MLRLRGLRSCYVTPYTLICQPLTNFNGRLKDWKMLSYVTLCNPQHPHLLTSNNFNRNSWPVNVCRSTAEHTAMKGPEPHLKLRLKDLTVMLCKPLHSHLSTSNNQNRTSWPVNVLSINCRAHGHERTTIMAVIKRTIYLPIETNVVTSQPANIDMFANQSFTLFDQIGQLG